MAFLVELRSPSASSSPADGRASDSTRFSAVRLFRRSTSTNTSTSTMPTSATVTENPELIPEDSLRSSSIDTERRLSLASLPARLRRKKTKSSIYATEQEASSASQLRQLFFSLPPEILGQILCYLRLYDIFSLRQTSHSMHSVLNSSAAIIARVILLDEMSDETPPYALSMYPTPQPCVNLNYLIQMLHRQKRIDRVIYHTASFTQMRLYAFNAQLYPFRVRLQTLLQIPGWIAYHFFETYRFLVLQEHDAEHEQRSGRFWSCEACSTATKTLVASYPAEEVLSTFHFLQLILLHYEAAIRPPAFSTRSRKLKTAGKLPSEEEYDAFVWLGGLEELSKMSMMQGSYKERLDVVHSLVIKVRTAIDINQANAKSALNGRLPSRPHTDLTKSLGPSYATLMQDQLDRLPPLADFLLPVWLERIEREGLNTGDEEELRLPFQWVQRVILSPERAGQANAEQVNGQVGLNNPIMFSPQQHYHQQGDQQQQQQNHAPQNGPVINPAIPVPSLGPTMAYYGAPPV